MDIPSYLMGKSAGGSGGTSDYSDLTNKPSINGVTLSGNKTSSDLGIESGMTKFKIPNTLTANYLQDYSRYQLTADEIAFLTPILSDFAKNEKMYLFELDYKYKIGQYGTEVKRKGIFSTWGYGSFTKPSSGKIYLRSQNARIYGAEVDFEFVGSWNSTTEVFTPTYIQINVGTDDGTRVLSTKNTTAFTPTANYHPATKKYVDDAITSAITTTLGGNY